MTVHSPAVFRFLDGRFFRKRPSRRTLRLKFCLDRGGTPAENAFRFRAQGLG